MSDFSSNTSRNVARSSYGFTIVELMVALTVSLLLLTSLVGIFVNTSRNQNDMVKANSVIEGGRVAVQLLQEDIVHAGFLGGFVPGFDDLSSLDVPGDVPTMIPNPCTPYAAWDSNYRSSLIGIPVQGTDALPAGAGCAGPLPHRAGTDVLVVRRADTCVAGVGNCEPDAAGALYFQPSFCAAEKRAGTVALATSTSVTLGMNASMVNGFYTGVMLRTISGTGAGQYRWIASYDGSTRVATINTPWAVIPDGTTRYSLEYAFGTSSFPLHRRDCVGTGTPATLPVTGGALAEKRRFVSNVYYITDVAHPERAGEVIPTLMRSRLDTSGGSIAQLAPEPLIEGIEAMRIELGIDDRSDTGDPVDYSDATDWTSTARTAARNRGDGAPDRYIRCTSSAPCTPADLTNVVAVKLYLLVRARDQTPGHTDSKTYCLGEPALDGTCPAGSTIAAANDNYKRHAFTSSVRLMNVSGRRETPP